MADGKRNERAQRVDAARESRVHFLPHRARSEPVGDRYGVRAQPETCAPARDPDEQLIGCGVAHGHFRACETHQPKPESDQPASCRTEPLAVQHGRHAEEPCQPKPEEKSGHRSGVAQAATVVAQQRSAADYD